MGWRGPLTQRQLTVWWEWQRLWREGDKPDLSLDGNVPKHIQARWEGKVGMAGNILAAGTERRVRARQIAERTGRDAGEVYDELLKQGK